MKVILLKDLKGTGKKNDIVNVSDGYANNYLIPNGIATKADNAKINENTQLKQAAAYHAQVELDNAKALGEKLKEVTLKMIIKCGESGKLFGSITSKDIAEELVKLGYNIDKKKIVIDPIKSLGAYTAVAKLHPKVSVQFKIIIAGE